MTAAANSFLSIAIGAGAPPDPYDSPQAWDSIRVAGVVSPGIYCVVGEFERRWDFDEKHSKGAKGSSLTFTGNHLARGEITFYLLYGPDPTSALGNNYTHLADWYKFSQLFKYDPTKQIATPVDIYHPGLAMINVSSVVCEGITNPVMTSTGVMVAKVKLIEFGPPPPLSVVSTPLASLPNPNFKAGITGPPGLVPDPTGDALQKQIAEQLAIAQTPL